MKCSEAGRYLADLSVGGLHGVRRIVVRWHVRHCRVCQLELKRLKRVDAVLKEYLQAPAAPADLWESIHAGLGDLSSRQPIVRRVSHSRAWSVAVAAAVVVLVLALFGVRSRTRSTIPEDLPEYEKQYVIAGWRDPLADHATAVTLVFAGGKTSEPPGLEGVR
ncbi:MAG: hypothetical protein ACUVRO_08500 [Armatimonadota bacterium]